MDFAPSVKLESTSFGLWLRFVRQTKGRPRICYTRLSNPTGRTK
jgi:hypothetical protein